MWYRLYHKGIGCIKPIYNLIMTNSNQIMSNWEKSHAIQKFLRPQVPSNKRFWFFVAMRNFLFLHWKSANELKWLILREARQSRIMQLLKRINQAGIRMLARLYDEIQFVLLKSFSNTVNPYLLHFEDIHERHLWKKVPENVFLWRFWCRQQGLFRIP